MSKELDCCWHFGIETGRSEGPFDATGQNFKQRPNASLLREAVQNSMDAHIIKIDMDRHESIPTVEIYFSFGSIKKSDYPEFFKLRENIKLCLNTYSNNEDYKMFYNSMLENFDTNYKTEIPFLKISDRNTTGMKYVENDLCNPFQAFVRSSQISIKGDSNGAAGSHGYGKAAYYLLSPIRTLLVSTMTEDGRCYFEGASIIGSHVINNHINSSVGYYDNNGGQPSSDINNHDSIQPNQIPEEFKRIEPGTDFYIMGFLPENINEICEEMIGEALRSYWLAIYKEKISITIKPNHDTEITINKTRLSDLMDSYFPSSVDESKQLRALNPRPYYEAYTKQNIGNNQYCMFSEKIPVIGNVSLYVKKCKTKFDKIVFMRKPYMLVFAATKDEDNGYYGLFICEDPDGDKLLKRLENSSHTEWKASNFRNAAGKKYPEGELALNEIKRFINTCIDKIFKKSSQNSLDIAGLSDFLYVPDNLIEDDVTNEHIIGSPTGKTTNDGASISNKITGNIIKQQPTTKDRLGSVIIQEDGKINKSEEEKHFVSTGRNDKFGSNGNSQHYGENISNVGIDTSNGKHWRILDVPIRVFCHQECGKNYHIIKIHCKNNIDNAKLILSIGLDDNNEENVPIVYSDYGIIKGNCIERLSLKTGTNSLKILFADNLPHTVIKKIYYEE